MPQGIGNILYEKGEYINMILKHYLKRFPYVIQYGKRIRGFFTLPDLISFYENLPLNRAIGATFYEKGEKIEV